MDSERERVGAAAGPTVTRTVSGVFASESSSYSPFTTDKPGVETQEEKVGEEKKNKQGETLD